MSIITLDELRSFITNSTETGNDAELEIARLAAEASVKRHCGRSFEKVTTATARTFPVASYTEAWVDDFWSLTDLAIKTDDDDDGTFETTWTSADYVLHPLEGRLSGETVPYHRIEAVESLYFPRANRRPNVLQVTATWGWATIPDSVRYACLMQAAADFSRRSSPHGVAAFGDFGPIRVRGTMDPRATELLRPYVHPRVAFRIGG